MIPLAIGVEDSRMATVITAAEHDGTEDAGFAHLSKGNFLRALHRAQFCQESKSA
ncbi:MULTISPECIES: hypothetical protein [unclassified Bradyrhizobium]|uniref:hypothetical protein n=1 Tax=unclassified Bradyrhizobium TaxID=2631580 RepID=UPI002FEF6B1B